MGNYKALPYSDNGEIFVSVNSIDNSPPNKTQKLLLYNDTPPEKLISIDLRKIQFETVSFTITAKIAKNKNCDSTIVRFDSAWTNFSIMKSINEKDSNETFDIFKTDIVVNKGNISGKCEIRSDYLDENGHIIEQSKIFFVQSDGRSGPDFKDGLFNWKHTEFLIDGEINEENNEFSWYQEVKDLKGLKTLFAIELQENNPINILINDSIEGNIISNVNQLSDEEKTINNLLYLIMGYGPFIIEVFKIYLFLDKAIDASNREEYLNDDNLLIEDNKVSLREKIDIALKEAKEHESKKMVAIAQLLFPSKKNSPEGSLIYISEMANNIKFNEILQKATVVYQQDLFKFDKKISNDLEELRGVIRNSRDDNLETEVDDD